jgi:hypothetical protein
LGDAYALLARYVIADRETLQAAAQWSALTWFADYATVLPLALITAPEKGCGKSTLLAALSKLASRPLLASNVTAAALFRAIERHPDHAPQDGRRVGRQPAARRPRRLL